MCDPQVGLGIGLLAYQIGGVAVVPIILVGLSTYCQNFVSKTIGAKRKAWNGKVQKRIGLTANILGSMKSIKIAGMCIAFFSTFLHGLIIPKA